MPRRVGIKRKVIAYRTQGRTSRGNPETYFFLMECGHVRREYHRPSSVMTTFGVEKKLGWTISCFDCKQGVKPNRSDMDKFPYRLFKNNPELEKIYQEAEE